MSSIYLDWAATAPPLPEIYARMQQTAQTLYANPSSIHAAGGEAENFLGRCRQHLAECLSCDPEELIFTSGATESNNMVLFSLLQKKRDRRILISGIEHPSVYQPAQTLKRMGFDVVEIAADSTCGIDPKTVLSALDERTVLVAVMLVNNETGRIQPLSEIAAGLRSFQKQNGKKILLHCDAVQAFGKIPLNPGELGVDSLALSAHKIGGPRGVGALYLRRGRVGPFLFSGGGQERELRPGTENLPGIHGFTLAAQRAVADLAENQRRAVLATGSLIRQLRGMPEVVLIPGCRADAPDPAEEQPFSPYILNFAVPPLPGEVLVRVLEEEGFIVSTGSACSSRKKKRIRVLENMGVSRSVASSAIRVSVGGAVNESQLQALADALKRRIPRLLHHHRAS
jgi:cysteine desulfurase